MIRVLIPYFLLTFNLLGVYFPYSIALVYRHEGTKLHSTSVY